MEHRRKNGYQFCDVQMAMVVDIHTGDKYRITGKNSTVGTLEEAMDFVSNGKMGVGDWQSRTVIVKLDCVKGFKLESDQ